MNNLLTIENLHIAVKNDGVGREIIKGVNLEVGRGEIHVIMGPNGSGKSTLALGIMGHPDYRIVKGDIKLDGTSMKNQPPYMKARHGLFLAFQYPPEIGGVKIIDYLRLLLEKVRGISRDKSYGLVLNRAREVWFREDDLKRYINDGFSGGERKRFEILQALLIDPKVLILDEPDSGVDVDSLSLISHKIREMQEEGKGIMLITHYGRILQHIEKENVTVHIMRDGKIVMSGDKELVERIEREGFVKIFKECGCNE